MIVIGATWFVLRFTQFLSVQNFEVVCMNFKTNWSALIEYHMTTFGSHSNLHKESQSNFEPTTHKEQYYFLLLDLILILKNKKGPSYTYTVQ